MCKALFLAAFPGQYLGLPAASNLHAKSIHGFRRQARTMKNLPEEKKESICFVFFTKTLML